MKLAQEIGTRIYNARSEKGFSQTALADAISQDRSAIARWESGRCTPCVSNLRDICKALRVSADYLLFGYKRTDLEGMLP